MLKSSVGYTGMNDERITRANLRETAKPRVFAGGVTLDRPLRACYKGIVPPTPGGAAGPLRTGGAETEEAHENDPVL